MSNLQEKVKKIFSDEKLDLLIGFEKGTLPLRAAPSFVRKSEDLDKLIFDITCQNNLAKHLLNEIKRNPDQKIGIIAKGCDARAIIHLISEKQLERKKIIIIGVPCCGVISPFKLKNVLNGREVTDCTINNETVICKGKDYEKEISRTDILSGYCLSCQYPNAPEYDYFIGEQTKPAPPEKQFEKVDELEKMTPDERWEYFKKEYSKCIRCNACRNACPMCFCDECFIDRNKPRWVGKGNDISDIMIYHIMRAIHLAGRCTSCGACSRACPMGIDIEALNKRVTKEIKERFGFTAGLDCEKNPALADYKTDDNDEFIM
ncbi:MAG: 4Fe-4S dicluster domain-containing protein [Victivallales bacterium]|nr:4Fe-4S dicluster domain-containing protein [Victivallales bacterium]